MRTCCSGIEVQEFCEPLIITYKMLYIEETTQEFVRRSKTFDPRKKPLIL